MVNYKWLITYSNQTSVAITEMRHINAIYLIAVKIGDGVMLCWVRLF